MCSVPLSFQSIWLQKIHSRNRVAKYSVLDLKLGLSPTDDGVLKLRFLSDLSHSTPGKTLTADNGIGGGEYVY